MVLKEKVNRCVNRIEKNGTNLTPAIINKSVTIKNEYFMVYTEI